MSAPIATAIIGGAVLVLLSVVILRVEINAHASGAPPDEALTVDAIVARVQPMPVLLQSVGQASSQHIVQVRPQISGVLKQVFFTEGQAVVAGQHLFLIEPLPFEAALASSKAAWGNARVNAQRMQPLVKPGYVTPQDYANARVAADQAEAAYKQAQINLSYTDMRAPISGRSGRLAVKSGNVVAPSDTAPRVIINEMQPIQVQFNIPQQFLPQVRRFQAQHKIRVFITREDSGGNLDEGTLVFIDNTVNTSTGTVMLMASLPNRQEQLWPGQTVGVNMQLSLETQAVVVPQVAVQTGQDGNYVYLVANGKAETRRVRVDRQMGDLAVISSGLNGDERVVLHVPRDLRAGMRVTAVNNGVVPRARVTLPNAS